MAINITKRREFIHHIFEFFKIEETDNLVSSYDMALTTKYPVDWNAFYQEIIKTSEKRILPMPKYFSDKVRAFKKLADGVRLGNGSIIRVLLKDGKYYDFVVDNFCNGTTLSAVKKRYSYKDEKGQLKTHIKKITSYPQETTLIGDSVYFNVNIVKSANMSQEEYERKVSEKENELKKQVKILFLASSEG
jgi:hypothetical protein